VFAAKSSIDGKRVAIKRVTHSTPKEIQDNFNEVKYALKCGDHPNIVRMKQCYEWKDECWMIMEFLEGGTLTEAKRGHEFEENEIAYVAREVSYSSSFY
jgi:serine/threonine protein kinase